MKLTEKRIKEIILEEINQIKENVEKPEDETKTLMALKDFMLTKTRETTKLKNASATEVQEIAKIIDLMFGLIGKGEISKVLEFSLQKMKEKAGIKNEQ